MDTNKAISISALNDRLRPYIRRRVYVEMVDDILAMTIERIWELEVRARESNIRNSADTSDPNSITSRSANETIKLAYTIARGLIADHYRSPVVKWSSQYLQELHEPAAEFSQERDLRASNALILVTNILANLSKRERALVRQYIIGNYDEPLDAKTRKQISRLREKLRTIVEERLGEPLATYFDGD